MKKRINIVIMGAPNSGKGTVCEAICKKFNLFHLSTGQILRDNIEQNTLLGRLAKPHMLDVVPDQLVVDMVIDKIKNTEEFDGIVFDGFPRTKNQAVVLDEKIDVDSIILLDVKQEDEQKLIQRAVNRLSCQNCKATLSKDMLKDGKCPHCGSIPISRDDSTVENIKHRIEVFKKETVPAINYFGDRITKIDAFSGKEEVISQIENALKNVLVKKW